MTNMLETCRQWIRDEGCPLHGETCHDYQVTVRKMRENAPVTSIAIGNDEPLQTLITIRRPNGDIETVAREGYISNPAVRAKMVAATREAGKGEIIGWEYR